MKPEDIVVALNRSLAVVECRKEEFLECVADLASNFENHTKHLYDFLKQEELSFNKKETEECAALRKLVIQNFDNEQIWQQLELQNKFVFEHETEKLSQLLTEIETSELKIRNEDSKASLKSLCIKNEPGEHDAQSVDSEVIPDSSSEYSNENEEPVPSRNYRVSVVDDEFFKLGEMEEFLVDEDKKAEDDGADGGSIDLFSDFDNKGQNLKYKEFFDPPAVKREIEHGQNLSSKKVTFQMNEDDDDDDAYEGDDNDDGMQSNEEIDNSQMEEDNDIPKPQDFLASSSDESDEAIGESGNKGPLSSYERHQRSMKAIISDLEAESINPKSWQLLGETDADKRPENSLLAEDLEYDQALRPALVITEDINEKMELLIKQRIKDQAWDDVQRKIKPIENIHEYKKRIVLDQEKSKLSLAEIYEKEYLEKQKGETEEAEPKEHVDIKKRLDLLFQKLDALSNYHFVPRKPEPEIKVVSNLPAMLLEDVQPVTKSDASQLAPEEILGKSRTELKGPSEVSAKDRNYSRRLKKRRQKNYFKRQKERLAAKAPHELTKEQAKKHAETFAKKNKNVKLIDEKTTSKPLKSKSFFSQLQDEVTSQISSRASEMKKKKAKRSNISGNSLKL